MEKNENLLNYHLGLWYSSKVLGKGDPESVKRIFIKDLLEKDGLRKTAQERLKSFPKKIGDKSKCFVSGVHQQILEIVLKETE